MVALIGASGELQEDGEVFTFRQTTVDVGGLMATSGKKRQDQMTYTVGEVLWCGMGPKCVCGRHTSDPFPRRLCRVCRVSGVQRVEGANPTGAPWLGVHGESTVCC